MKLPQAAFGGNAFGLPTARHRRPEPATYPARWIGRRCNVSPTVARLVSEAHFGEVRQ